MYAVIEDSGTQFKVSQGDVLHVDLRELKPDQATISFDRVLLIGDDADQSGLKVGTPFVEGAKVTGEIVAQEKTPRVEVVKFKRRKNSLRRKGHRQEYLKVKITSIQG